MWFAINARPGCEGQVLSLLRDGAEAAGLAELFVPQARVRAREAVA